MEIILKKLIRLSLEYFTILNCRAKVQKILSDDQLVVYKCDYGSIDLLAANALRPLDSEFTQMPQLAIQAKAHGMLQSNYFFGSAR